MSIVARPPIKGLAELAGRAVALSMAMTWQADSSDDARLVALADEALEIAVYVAKVAATLVDLSGLAEAGR